MSGAIKKRAVMLHCRVERLRPPGRRRERAHRHRHFALWWPALLKGGKMAKIGAVGRPTGRIWCIWGTPINTGPGGEVVADVRAAECARNVLNGRHGGKTGSFWSFLELLKPSGCTTSLERSAPRTANLTDAAAPDPSPLA